jgi:hypothetical protein
MGDKCTEGQETSKGQAGVPEASGRPAKKPRGHFPECADGSLYPGNDSDVKGANASTDDVAEQTDDCDDEIVGYSEDGEGLKVLFSLSSRDLGMFAFCSSCIPANSPSWRSPAWLRRCLVPLCTLSCVFFFGHATGDR